MYFNKIIKSMLQTCKNKNQNKNQQNKNPQPKPFTETKAFLFCFLNNLWKPQTKIQTVGIGYLDMAVLQVFCNCGFLLVFFTCISYLGKLVFPKGQKPFKVCLYKSNLLVLQCSVLLQVQWESHLKNMKLHIYLNQP